MKDERTQRQIDDVNILILIQQMGRGGAERVAANLFEVLSAGHNVHIVTLTDGEIAYGMADRTIVIPRRSVSSWNFLLRFATSVSVALELRRLKRGLGVELTYSIGISMGALSLLAGGKDIKVVAQHDNLTLPSAFSLRNIFWRRPRLRNTVRRHDSIVAISEGIRTEIVRLTKGNPSKVATITNGHDIDAIVRASLEPLPPEVAGVSRPFVLAVGRLVPEKRFDHLLRAFSMTRSEHDVDLIICGSDPDNQKGFLERLARALGIADHVHFVPFIDNPFSLMRNAEALVLSSATEGFPNVMIEALACGTRVVATDCSSGPREILSTSGAWLGRAFGAPPLDGVGVLVPVPRDRYADDDVVDLPNARILGDAIGAVLEAAGTQPGYARDAEARARAFDIAAWHRAHEQLFSALADQRASSVRV